MDEETFFQLCEALLFVSPDPVMLEDIQRTLGQEEVTDVETMFDRFRKTMNSRSSGLEIRAVAGGYQLVTRPQFTPFIRRLNTVQARARLSRAALETLAIIAYRQPVTVPEIEHIRGVDSSGVVRNLLEKGLLTILGKRKVPGNPILYGTTPKFLVEFGLADLGALPEIENFRKLMAARDNHGPELPFGSTDQDSAESTADDNESERNPHHDG